MLGIIKLLPINTGVSAAGVKFLLDYVYTSKLALSLANVQDVLSAASHLQVLTSRILGSIVSEDLPHITRNTTFCRAGAKSGGGVLQLPAGPARRGELRGHRHHRRDVLARHAARQGLPLHVRESRRLRAETRVSSSFCPSGT